MSNIWANSYIVNNNNHNNNHNNNYNYNNNSGKMSAKYDNDNIYESKDKYNGQNKSDNDNNNDDDSDDYDDDYNDNDFGDSFRDVLRLKLHKPKHWKWELYTAKSTENIEMPRILLYDHYGKLLVDTKDNNDEKVYAEDTAYNVGSAQNRHTPEDSWNYHHSVNAMKTKFDDLNIKSNVALPSDIASLNSSGSYCSQSHSSSRNRSRTCSRSQSMISSKGLHLKITTIDNGMDPYSQIPIFLPTPPSTISTPTLPNTSSSPSSEPRAKRRVRRSHSSPHSPSIHSESILERLSCRRISSSSSSASSPIEYTEESHVTDSKSTPHYFLRSSKAGTLIVKEDSFQLHSQRRRRKYLRRISSDASNKRVNTNAVKECNLSNKNKMKVSKESFITEEELDGSCS